MFLQQKTHVDSKCVACTALQCKPSVSKMKKFWSLKRMQWINASELHCSLRLLCAKMWVFSFFASQKFAVKFYRNANSFLLTQWSLEVLSWATFLFWKTKLRQNDSANLNRNFALIQYIFFLNCIMYNLIFFHKLN